MHCQHIAKVAFCVLALLLLGNLRPIQAVHQHSAVTLGQRRVNERQTRQSKNLLQDVQQEGNDEQQTTTVEAQADPVKELSETTQEAVPVVNADNDSTIAGTNSDENKADAGSADVSHLQADADNAVASSSETSTEELNTSDARAAEADVVGDSTGTEPHSDDGRSGDASAKEESIAVKQDDIFEVAVDLEGVKQARGIVAQEAAKGEPLSGEGLDKAVDKASDAQQVGIEEPLSGEALDKAVDKASAAQQVGKEEPLSGEALDKAVDKASDAEQVGKEENVVAQVVEQAPAVELSGGDGDVSTTGKCQPTISQHCQSVAPGEGRLADCLTLLLADPKVTLPEDCKKELDKFKLDLSVNINANLPLAKACKGDIAKHCGNADDGKTPGSVLACLREYRPELSDSCASEVFKMQVEAANDFRADAKLYEKCKVDAENLCPNVTPENGAVQECMGKQRAQLSWDCQEELFRQEVENADDLRLSVRLFKKCLVDKRKFCNEVQPGNARAIDCLEEHRSDAGFTALCKAELEEVVARRVADFRLDPQLRTSCVDDVKRLCGYQGASLTSMPDTTEHSVVKCLQDFSDEIQSEACKARMYKLKSLAADDIRFDAPLAEACYNDRQTLCKEVPPGSARVIRCLMNKGARLSAKCSALLFDHEVSMAESIDFQAPMKAACAKEHQLFCEGIPHGQGRVIRCLQDNKDKPEYSEACKQEIELYENQSSADYRLNFRLQKFCTDAILQFCAVTCADVKNHRPCGGSVLRCLTDVYENITQSDCQAEVFYYMKMEVRDYRNDMVLAAACRGDVESHCKEVKPGDSRVIQCLSDKRGDLSKECRSEVIRSEMLQASNIELRPGIARACADERKVHCTGVRSGKARVLNCLLTKAEQVDFSPRCVASLRDMVVKRVKDWRMDYSLRGTCRRDVTEMCTAEVGEQDSGTGAVITCLMRSMDYLHPPCRREVTRAVRTALDLYTEGVPGINVCDPVVSANCMKTDAEAAKQAVGNIRTCLTNHYLQKDGAANTTHNKAPPTDGTNTRRLLSGGPGSLTCEQVVAISNPPDVYQEFHKSLKASGLVVTLQLMEQTLGVKRGTLVKPRAQTPWGITLTGFWALAGMVAMAALLLGGVGHYFFKDWMNPGSYTMVMKQRPTVTVSAGNEARK